MLTVIKDKCTTGGSASSRIFEKDICTIFPEFCTFKTFTRALFIQQIGCIVLGLHFFFLEFPENATLLLPFFVYVFEISDASLCCFCKLFYLFCQKAMWRFLLSLKSNDFTRVCVDNDWSPSDFLSTWQVFKCLEFESSKFLIWESRWMELWSAELNGTGWDQGLRPRVCIFDT